jgi:SAM-dependent methyltransferase
MPGLEPIEISDVIVDYDVETLVRRPVRRDDAVARLMATGQSRPARYVASLPATDGVLDAAVCDGILLRSHAELQRLNEEFLQADRVRRILLPILRMLREEGVAPPYRVVDVGCGLGYLVRALAAHGRLGRDVELIGCDMNAALVERAAELARHESLACEFRLANAFRLAQPAHVFTSTGVLHHFRGPGLAAFFAEQREAYAFVHFDMQASPLSPLGSWVFHVARMREPLARHDGVVSAKRAHPPAALLAAARPVPGFTCADLDGCSGWLGVILRPMHAVLGVRTGLWPRVTQALGPMKERLWGAP